MLTSNAINLSKFIKASEQRLQSRYFSVTPCIWTLTNFVIKKHWLSKLQHTVEASVFMVGPSIAFLQLFSFYDSVNKIFIVKFVWNDNLFNLARSLLVIHYGSSSSA